MKKIIALSFVTFLSLYASEKISIPMPADSLSIENSGTKSAIDAYQDGVGIYTLESLGGNKVDNSEMNALVFKYGDVAKELNINVKDYVQTNGTDKEKALAGNVGKFEPMVPGNGTVCNDNNVQTINDIYTNGVCAGVNVEGQSCNDNNSLTFNDKYVNGICVGNPPQNATFQLLFGNGASIQGGAINFKTSQIYGYRVEGNGPKGYHSITMQEVYNYGIKELKYKVTSGSCGTVYVGRIGNIDYNNMNNTSYGTSNTEFTFNLDTKKVNIVGPLDSRWSRTLDLSAYQLNELVIGMAGIQAGDCWTSWSF